MCLSTYLHTCGLIMLSASTGRVYLDCKLIDSRPSSDIPSISLRQALPINILPVMCIHVTWKTFAEMGKLFRSLKWSNFDSAFNFKDL